jgi:hypothetical protein
MDVMIMADDSVSEIHTATFVLFDGSKASGLGLRKIIWGSLMVHGYGMKPSKCLGDAGIEITNFQYRNICYCTYEV